MSVFSRFTDIINANINSLLEKAEDPEKIIRLMIQEMEDTLVEIRSAAAKCIADRKEQRRYAEFLNREQEGWAKRAELAVRQGREDLARAHWLKSRLWPMSLNKPVKRPHCLSSNWKNSTQISHSYKAS